MTTDTKRRALGRGLEALLPPKPAVVPVVQAAEQGGGHPLEIECGLIDRNPFQTRTQFDEAKLGELAQSISATRGGAADYRSHDCWGTVPADYRGAAAPRVEARG